LARSVSGGAASDEPSIASSIASATKDQRREESFQHVAIVCIFFERFVVFVL